MSLETLYIERFALLFAGLTRAKGRYVSHTDPSQLVVGDKAKGKATTIQEPVTLDDYRRHLEGELGLGIVPIRDDGTCVFGAIDVDQYAGLDHAALVQKIEDLGLKAYVCRSKSGGAHIYIFFPEPGVKAQLVIDYLKKVRSQLGIDYRKAREIFPKQSKQAGGIGNWINMPYFGDSLRRCFKKDGSQYTLQEFLDVVVRMDHAAVTKPDTAEDGLALAELPPCLERLAQEGIPAGMRNEALFNFTVFAAKKTQLDRPKTVKMLDLINMKVCQPPVPSTELRTTLDSVLRHEYNYRCEQSPLVDCCDKVMCAMRPFGPSASMHPNDLPQIERIEIRGDEADETKYYVKLVQTPKMVVCDSRTLNDYELFRRAVQDTAHVRLPDVKKKTWDAYLTAKWETLKEVVRSAPERSKKGMVNAALEEWIKQNATEDASRFALGQPYVEGKHVYITLHELQARVKSANWKPTESVNLVQFLEDSGWEKVSKVVDNRAYDSVWTRLLDIETVNKDNIEIKEVEGHTIIEAPKDVPASTFEEYDGFQQFIEEQS